MSEPFSKFDDGGGLSTKDECSTRSIDLTSEALLIEQLQAWIDNEEWDPLPASLDTENCWKLLLENPDIGLASVRHVSAAHSAFEAVDREPMHEPSDRTLDSLAARTSREKVAERVAQEKPRFQPVRHLGAGAFGIVIHAYDTRLQRDVAIKMMRPSLGLHRKLTQRFLREARAVASLQHRGIVQVFETGVIGDRPCIVGELIDGPNLADYVKSQGALLSPRKSAWLVQQIAAAVHFAHTRGILHRDLKPSNILMAAAPPAESEGIGYQPRLTDFGLAKRFDRWQEPHDDLTADIRTVGTLRYMSPEQASGRLHDVAVTSDVFSLGVVLYQLLAARLPFNARLDYEVAEQICRVDPPRLRKLNPNIPRDLEAIVAKCLNKEPDDRYNSAKALADDLQCFLSGLPVAATRPSAIQTIRYWVKIYPRKFAATAVVVTTILVACVSSSVAWWKERYQRERVQTNLRLAETLVETAFFPLAEKLNDGATITHEDHRTMLLSVLQFHQKHAEQSPDDADLLHRLSVAHHFAANGFTRLGQYGKAEQHRDECLRILKELLERDPANRRMYLYQSFMAHLLVSNERYRGDVETDLRIRSHEMQMAADILTELLQEEPENVDYADAFNSLRIQMAAHLHTPPDQVRQLAQGAVDSSLRLWREHPSRELLAKHAVSGYLQLSKLDLTEGRAEEALGKTTLAKQTFDEAFGASPVGDWNEHTFVELHIHRVKSLLMMQQGAEALEACNQALDEADALLKRQHNGRTLQCGMLALHELQEKVCKQIGDVSGAEQAAQRAATLAAALKQ